MAVLSTLVKALAEVEGLEETQVAWVGRYLREAGLVSSGGRGRGGAQMTVTDAANLLIGVNATSAAKEAVGAVVSIRDLTVADEVFPISEDIKDDSRLSMALYQPQSAAACIENLIGCFTKQQGKEAALDEVSSPHISISFSRPRTRVIIRVADLATSDDETDDLYALLEFGGGQCLAERFADKADRTTITHRTLAALGRTLSE
ncbi:hypothetical protein ACSD7O_08045 [Methylorubrum extorquens]|uniref:hypothetical protein n=1 Tax=Methylorubrum extorquens TaxID=408 RepID=UPI003F624742